MLRDAPIQRKLMTMILVTTGVVLFLACSAFLAYEYITYRQASIRELASIGEIVAAESTGMLAFDNAKDATEILAALKAERHIVGAALYDRQGKIFARYPAEAKSAPADLPSSPLADGYHFIDGFLISCTPVIQEGRRFGTLLLKSDTEAVRERLRLYSGIAALVITGAFLVAYFLSRALQRQISRPIQELAEAARAVSDRRDYTVRAPKRGADEIGLLTDTFNHMLARIQEQNTDLERRVRARTLELEAANAELEAFCSSAAHDLRTPLRAITGFTDVLLDERATQLPTGAKRYVNLIRTGSAQMTQLVQDLLSFSRLGRQELTREEIDIESLCHQVVEDLSPEIEGREVDIRVEKLPSIYGDPALMRVVLANLMSNAFKYTRSRTPALIRIGTLAKVGEPGPVIFIADNGVGFDMSSADKLFGLFQRLHHAHEFEGTGVGLATVRRIIERHGGRIWAESVLNEGATFFFVVPPETPGRVASADSV